MFKKMVSVYKSTWIFFMSGLLLISFQAGAGWAQDLPGLFTAADKEITANRMPVFLPDRIKVTVDFSLIKPSGAPRTSMQAALPDRVVVLLRDRTETRGEDNYTWVGRVEGHELSTAVITVVNGVAVGHIDINGQTYSLQPQNGGYQIVKEDAALAAPFYEDERVPVIPPQTGKSYMPVYPAYLTPEDGSRIDVLVLYTQQMTNTYGTGLAAKIQNFVDLANTAYTNSGINTQISLVNSSLFTEAGAAEGVSMSNALDYITGTSGGMLTGSTPAAIQTLRETYKADMVALLRVYPGTGSCGLGWVMQTVSSAFADYAFSVSEVKDSGSGGYYCDSRTFAHELGHNMGCAHDRANASQTGAYSYSYGYGISGTFGTVMSYISPKITYFSTPLVNYGGVPIGKDETLSDSADNVKSINNTRTTVANFRAAAATTITCTYTISPASQTFSSSGGAGSVAVTASDSSCAWTATSALSWVSITTGSGAGSGTAVFSVSANTTGASRTGNITVAGQTFTLTQSAGSQTVLLVTTPSQTYFDTIQAAYAAAVSGSSILVQGTTLTENLVFSQNNSITLTGGYDSSFSAVGGTMTTVQGSLTVSGGTLTISNIVIQ